MRKLPRIYIYSKEDDVFLTSDMGFSTSIDDAISFGWFSLRKYSYLMRAKRNWEWVISDWSFRKIQIMRSKMKIRGGGIRA